MKRKSCLVTSNRANTNTLEDFTVDDETKRKCMIVDEDLVNNTNIESPNSSGSSKKQLRAHISWDDSNDGHYDQYNKKVDHQNSEIKKDSGKKSNGFQQTKSGDNSINKDNRHKNGCSNPNNEDLNFNKGGSHIKNEDHGYKNGGSKHKNGDLNLKTGESVEEQELKSNNNEEEDYNTCHFTGGTPTWFDHYGDDKRQSDTLWFKDKEEYQEEEHQRSSLCSISEDSGSYRTVIDVGNENKISYRSTVSGMAIKLRVNSETQDTKL